MKKYFSEYIEYINGLLENKPQDADVAVIKKEHLVKIEFMQHERLIHFLVTMMFALILILSICAYILVDGASAMLLLPLIVLVLALVIAYIRHYYFLENNVQRLYFIYDRLTEWEKEKQDEK